MQSKVKILSTLLGISGIFGYVFPTPAHAMITPNDTAQINVRATEGEEVSPGRLELMCYGAYARQMRTGNTDEVNELRERVRTGRIVMQIDAPHALFHQNILENRPNLFRISDICAALRAASTYYRLTHDQTLINRITQFIIDNNINVNDDDGRILHSAVREGEPCENFVRFLLEERHANPDIQYSEDGNTALHLAVLFARTNMANILLDNGANPYISNHNGLTPYGLADGAPGSLGLEPGRHVSDEVQAIINEVRNVANILRSHGITH